MQGKKCVLGVVRCFSASTWSGHNFGCNSWIGCLGLAPTLGRHRESLANQFLEALQVHQWQVGQCGVLFARPLLTQQDHILFHILLALGSGQLRDKVVGHIAVGPQDTLRTPSFGRCPGVNTDACRVMLRTLAGMEDFARTNAHFFRWDTHPTIRHSACERLCLHCLLNSPDQRLDSE